MKVVRIVTVAVFVLSVFIWGIGKFHAMRADVTPPVITADSDVIHVSTKADEAELKKGLTAIDDVDGDITDGIVVANISTFSAKGVCTIEYLAFDKNNNVGHYERTVYFDDYESPEIRLTAPLMYKQNGEIILSDRLYVKDQLEGDISDKLRFSAAGVTPYETGVYELRVEARNSYGDSIKETLLLNIVPYENARGHIQLTDYLIYVSAGEEVYPRDYIEEVVDNNGDPVSSASVIITREVDTSNPGAGQFRYEVVDDYGNVTAITFLAVIVTE